jgi:fatty-acid peroxygenase
VTPRRSDRTIAFLNEGYAFGGNECDRHNDDAAAVRLALRPATVVRGRQAAETVYDTFRFRRDGAMPRRVKRTLLGKGGVQGLDGEEHRRRKAVFLSLLTGTAPDELAAAVVWTWRERLPAWEARDRIVLLDEVATILCEAVSGWAGLPVAGAALALRTRDLHALIDSGAKVGPPYWRGVQARRRAERGLAQTVMAVRDGHLRPAAGTALAVLADHRDTRSALLEPRIVAVELLNILRPTVAIDRFIVFAALALHEHPDWRERLDRFVHEVRRFYPFFPMVAAVAREPVSIGRVQVPSGERVLLDLYATNHHRDLWPHPERFDPDRFASGEPDPFALVPQGGGHPSSGHRCAGEQVTVAVMKAAVRLLVEEIDYTVPPQDLSVSLRRIPTQPADGMVITDVRSRTQPPRSARDR